MDSIENMKQILNNYKEKNKKIEELAKQKIEVKETLNRENNRLKLSKKRLETELRDIEEGKLTLNDYELMIDNVQNGKKNSYYNKLINEYKEKIGNLEKEITNKEDAIKNETNEHIQKINEKIENEENAKKEIASDENISKVEKGIKDFHEEIRNNKNKTEENIEEKNKEIEEKESKLKSVQAKRFYEYSKGIVLPQSEEEVNLENDIKILKKEKNTIKMKSEEEEENTNKEIYEYTEILKELYKISEEEKHSSKIEIKEEAIKEQQSKHKNAEKAQENTDAQQYVAKKGENIEENQIISTNMEHKKDDETISEKATITDAIDQQNSESPEKKNKTVSKSKEELHNMSEYLDKFVLGPEDHIEENLTEKQKVYKDYGDIEGVEEEFQKDTIGTKAERENQEELDNTTKQELYKNFEGLNEAETTAIEIQDNKNNKKEIVIKESTNEVIVDGNQEKSLQLNEILKNKAKIFNRSNVNQISKEITGNRFKAFLLKRKINPAVIRVLENEEEIKEYLTAIYNKETKELPFDLIHDMTDSKLNLVDKIKMKRFAKTENRLGAKVIGKGYDLNTALEAGTQSRESTEEKKENRFLSDIDQRDNPNVDPKKALEQAQEKAASVETIKIKPEDIKIGPNEKD